MALDNVVIFPVASLFLKEGGRALLRAQPLIGEDDTFDEFVRSIKPLFTSGYTGKNPPSAAPAARPDVPTKILISSKGEFKPNPNPSCDAVGYAPAKKFKPDPDPDGAVDGFGSGTAKKSECVANASGASPASAGSVPVKTFQCLDPNCVTVDAAAPIEPVDSTTSHVSTSAITSTILSVTALTSYAYFLDCSHV